MISARCLTRCLTARRWFSTQAETCERRANLLDIKKKYNERKMISMVTAYDYTSAKEVERAGIDVILVGDSLGMVMLGRKSTSTVSMEEMIHHCRAVARGSSKTFTIADLPFGSYEASKEDAARNAIRLVKEGEVSAVKLEGGRKMKDKIKAIVDVGIPVMGHIGLTPQTALAHSGFRVQGKTGEDAAGIYLDALALQEAGCFGLVIESVPEVLGDSITKALQIPTFGIGAGRHTSGQVLVYHDLLGLYSDFVPKFCKQYAKLSDEIHKGLTEFRKEVESNQFPAPAHTYSIKDEEWEKATEIINQTLREEMEQAKTPATKQIEILPSNMQFIDFASLVKEIQPHKVRVNGRK